MLVLACALPAVLAPACAKTVTVPSSSYSELEGMTPEHGLRITMTDGEIYRVARARATGDSLEIIELMALYDERNTGSNPAVPFTIPLDEVASVEEVRMRSKTSLVIAAAVAAGLLAGLGWIFTQAGGGR